MRFSTTGGASRGFARSSEDHDGTVAIRIEIPFSLPDAPQSWCSIEGDGQKSPAQFATLKERIKDLTSSGTGKLRLQEVRRRLIEQGVLFTLFQFRPYSEDRSANKDSVMLIRSRDGNLVPASRMSTLIRQSGEAEILLLKPPEVRSSSQEATCSAREAPSTKSETPSYCLWRHRRTKHR
jgi:hypothetical protein